MKTVDIAIVLSPDLGSRAQARRFLQFVEENYADEAMEIDFGGVQFSSRAFIDEFYNLVLSPSAAAKGLKVEAVNMREDISTILASVIRTNTTQRSTSLMNPSVGIFWYDSENQALFGVHKEELPPSRMEAAAREMMPFIVYPELNREVWEREHFPGDYDRTPRGRVSWIINKFVVLVGSWARPIQDELTTLLEKEFSLPHQEIELIFDTHWDLVPSTPPTQ